MQDCFRLHPEVYGAELMDDEEGEGAPAAGSDVPVAADSMTPEAAVDAKAPVETLAPAEEPAPVETKAVSAGTPKPVSSKAPIYDDDLPEPIPEKAVDATAATPPTDSTPAKDAAPTGSKQEEAKSKAN